MKVNGPYVHKTGKMAGRKYICIRYDDGHRTSMLYSRFLMEQKLGRSLSTNEHVVHKDGDVTNDDLDNLEVKVRLTKENESTKVYVSWLICPWCKNSFERIDNAISKIDRRKVKVGPFCQELCQEKWKRLESGKQK